MEQLFINGVRANLHYIPVYRQPYYARMGFETTAFPKSERYFSEAISLPMYPKLTFSKLRRVVKIVKEALRSDFLEIR
jgi:dTDP-4-amino-4,6-dideoxygalactose transaminase